MALKSLIPRRSQSQIMRWPEYSTDVFGSIHREMDRLFDRLMGGMDFEPFASMETMEGEFLPSVDVVESDEEITVTAELPGMTEKDIDLTVTKEALTLKGRKNEEKESKEKDYYRAERCFGSFSRVIPLSSDVDETKTDAQFKNGVLTVHLPKTPEARQAARKVQIKTE
jgi:HSP20 family protein